MNKIKDMKDLRVEILRLQALQKEQRDILRKDLKEIREGLKPSTLIKDMLSSIVSRKFVYDSLFTTGLGFGITFFIKRLLFRKSNKGLVKGFFWHFLQNIISRILRIPSRTLNQSLKSLFNFIKRFSVKKEHHSEKDTPTSIHSYNGH